MADETLLTLTSDIVSAHVSNNAVAAGDVPTVIAKIYEALNGLGKPVEEAPPAKGPAVSIRASVTPAVHASRCSPGASSTRSTANAMPGISPIAGPLGASRTVRPAPATTGGSCPALM